MKDRFSIQAPGYTKAIQTLLEKGSLLPTEAELEEMSCPEVRGEASAMTPKSDAESTGCCFEAEGRRFVIRFKIEDDREIVWNDMVRGQISWRQRLGGDMVIARIRIGQPL